MQSPEYMSELIEATMILHNWLIDLEDLQEDVELEPWMLVGFPPGVGGVLDGDDAKQLRESQQRSIYRRLLLSR